ncbi:MAG: preprotein translocase subunit SecA [Dehalococcoidia bacterium]
MGLLSKAKNLIGDSNARELKKLTPIPEEVNAWESQIQELTDPQLREKTDEFVGRLRDGADLDDILPEAFAVVREAGRRWLGMRHYDVQLIGGVVLHQGKIAEMRTGEGKTLVATLPLYLNALEGDGAHLITVNDYLAKRDARWMSAIYHGLGLSVGVLQHQASFLYDPDYDPTQVEEGEEIDDEEKKRRAALGDLRYLRPCTRQEAYAADITYGTNNEYGFDYLRDNMVTEQRRKAQRPLTYAIVDEVDNILIDEARTPLIISGQAEEPPETYRTFARIVPSLEEGVDFTAEAKSRTVSLTEPGIDKVERTLGIDNLFEGENARLTRFLEAALRAQFMYHRDQEYVVRNGQVIIVDEFTGRMMEGRRYSEGLHQAIEAKESVKIERETVTLATITYQNYFRMYRKLAGMTGTAVTEAEELNKIYSLEVVVIPTDQPMIREDRGDMIFRTEAAKYRAAADEIERLHERGQPALVGTASVESSELLSDLLRRRGIGHEVLNAKNHEREAQIIANAGQRGAVTIATNMAGRGTDIQLGEGIADLGGLMVVGTERHESRRIDNQLRGRAGRQGDPGASRFYVSFEDTIMRRFTPDWLPGMLEKLGMDDDMPLESGMVGKALEQAQQKVEGHHFDIRKHLVEYDDVINRQREVIYGERDKVLAGEDVHSIVVEMIEEEIRDIVGAYATGGPADGLDLDPFWAEAGGVVPLGDFEIDEETEASWEALEGALIDHALALYEQKEEEIGAETLRQLERLALLRIIDRAWIQHLTEMDTFRQGVGLQAYGQQDPLVTYKREAFDMFTQLTHTIRREVSRALLHLRKAPAAPAPGARGTPTKGARPATPPAAGSVKTAADTMGVRAVRESSSAGTSTATVTATVPKVGRNQPCPCGSGKKYKKCHGAAA